MLEKPFKNYCDFEHPRRVLMRKTTEGTVPIIELAADPEIMSAVTGMDFPAERALEIYYLGPNITWDPTPPWSNCSWGSGLWTSPWLSRRRWAAITRL